MADSTQFTVPTMSDPNIGIAYGNILDRFDLPAYNIKLYLMRESASRSAPGAVASDSEQLITTNADTVVLAQTAVTGTQIDNLVIEQLLTVNGFIATTVKFDVEQPGAADFLDQIQLARSYLGLFNTALPTLFLEVTFKGYGSDTDDIERSGEIVQNITPPYRFKLSLTNMSVQINERGSTYNIECVAENHLAFQDDIFKLPKDITTTGKTITEHVRDLEKQLNQYHKDSVNPEGPDEIKFDLSAFIQSTETPSPLDPENLIADDSVFTSSSKDVESANRISTQVFATGNSIDTSEDTAAAPRYSGDSAEVILEEDKITIRAGDSINRYFAILLSMNQDFINRVTRKTDINNPDDSDVNKDAAYVSWYRFDSTVEQIEFVHKRKNYRRRYTFKPLIYKTVRTDVGVTSAEIEFSGEQGKKRLDQIVSNRGLMKSYQYLFTGTNDQILNLDISYNNGHTLLLTPNGGATGVSVVSDAFASQVSTAVDTTVTGLQEQFVGKATTVEEKARVLDFFNRINANSDRISDVDRLVGDLSDQLNKSPDEISRLIQNANQQTDTQAFFDSFGTQTIQGLAANAQITTTAPTEPDAIAVNSNGDVYTPMLSGYHYSADILNPELDPVYADQLAEKGYIKLDASQQMYITQSVSKNKDLPNPVQSATTRNRKVENKLFGNLVNQHAANQFLMSVDLTLRGDPWYLGGPVDRPASERNANWYLDDQCFWLTIKTPTKYDADVTDEDSELNSGYWKFDGVSQTFSGVYRIVSVTNRFSRGAYTCEVRANREIGSDRIDKSSSTDNSQQLPFSDGNTQVTQSVPELNFSEINFTEPP